MMTDAQRRREEARQIGVELFDRPLARIARFAPTVPDAVIDDETVGNGPR
jgi:hypothetical protein